MPELWQERTLGSLATYLNGYAFKPRHWGTDGLPIVRIRELLDDSVEPDRYAGNAADAFRIDDGELVFSWSATLAAVIWQRGPALLNQHLFKVTPAPDVDRDFLCHLLNFHLEALAARSHGTTMKHITRGDLADYSVLIPPLEEQQRVAEALGTVDAQIRVADRILAKLSRIKAGIVADVTAADWPMHRLGDLADHVTSGSRGWASYYADEGATFIRIGNLTRAHINLRFDSVVRVAVPSGAEGSRTGLQPGDLLISITADLGIIGVVPDDLGEAYVNQHIALVRVDPRTVSSRWLGHYLSSPRGQEQFRRLNDQGAKSGLNLPTVANLQVGVPSMEEQARFVAGLDAIDSRIAYLTAEISKWKDLRSGLTADLMTGRIRVPVGATA